MNKYLKKFSIMFIMAFAIMLGTCISAFADDSYTENLIPTMTSNTYPSGIASSSSILGTSYNAWNAFDSDTKGGWLTQVGDIKNAWLAYEFPDNLKINQYVIKSTTDKNWSTALPKNWTFEGTNDGINWVVLDTRTNITWKQGEIKYFTFYNDNSYKKYRIKITDNNGDVNIAIGELQMMAQKQEISLNNSTMNLNVGDAQQLTATTTPAGAQVTWTSSDSSIATVDSNGNVTGVKEGQATITATTADGLTATCTVTVSKEDESISLNKSTTDLTTGDSETLIATTTPSEVNVTWSSSDTSVATVDSTGKVTAIGAGTATITATTTDGSNLSASCAVNVTPKDTTTPTEPTGDANLYIELVDGQIKQYTVSSDEINKFTEWYENRDNDHSLPATYKFTKGSYTDYVVQNQIDWFEVR